MTPTATRGSRRRAARRARAGLLLACLVLLAGCASMPDSGEITKVGGEQHADAESQVRVYGVKPQSGESPTQIVRGFLEATTSDEPRYTTAREYLAPALRGTWNPGAGITVLDGGPSVGLARGGTGHDRTAAVTLSGTRLATVDSRHAYHPAASGYRGSLHLSRIRGEWRIDRVDDGLILSRDDFQRIYRSVDTYYFASLGRGGTGDGRRRDVLVADPVYLRTYVSLLTSAVQTLLAGPGAWLRPVAGSAFPPGAAATSVSVDDSQNLQVRLNAAGSAGLDTPRCRRMAAQLAQTVQDVVTTPLASTRVQRDDGATACTMSGDEAQEYSPGQLSGPATEEFYIDDRHRLVSLSGSDDTTAAPVAGPFGDGAVPLGSVAIRRDERFAAGVRAGAGQLYVAALTDGAALGRPVLTSSGPRPDQRLSAPSWDGYGDLWIADRNPAYPRLVMLRGGTGTPVDVAVPDLGRGRVESLRVAADGVRIALLVEQDGRTTLRLGRIERSGTPSSPVIKVTGLRKVTPQLEDVQAASWAGTSRLVVVGRQSGSVKGQIQYVDTDGSVSYTPTLPGIGGVASVAASDDPDKPLLAQLNDGIFIFRLPLDANWREVSPAGSYPVYPG